MNFQNMEYFLAVAKEGNITRAAQKLRISQQALSNTISRMEAELKCQLFDRKQGLTLTYAGRRYRDAVQKMLDLNRQTETMLADISGNIRGELHIGISYTRGQAILPRILPAFQEKYPLIDLSVLEESTRVLEQRLENGDIDVMIGFAPFMTEHAESVELMRDRLYLVLPKVLLAKYFGENADETLAEFKKTHDIGLFREFPYVMLEEGDRIRTIMDHVFSSADIMPDIRFETRNTQTAVALASEGIGATVCPELYLRSNYIASGEPDSYIRRRVSICPLFADDVYDSIAIGYNRDRYLTQAASDFIKMSLSAMKEANDGSRHSES